jgi:hypothetical protein
MLSEYPPKAFVKVNGSDVYRFMNGGRTGRKSDESYGHFHHVFDEVNGVLQRHRRVK